MIATISGRPTYRAEKTVGVPPTPSQTGSAAEWGEEDPCPVARAKAPLPVGWIVSRAWEEFFRRKLS